MSILEHAILIMITFPCLILLIFLINKMIKGRYLNLYNVGDILSHFGGILETQKGIVIKGIYKKVEVLNDFKMIDEIVIEFNGVELSRQRLTNPVLTGEIKLESFFKRDVERFLKKRYRIMKREIRERKLEEKLIEDENLNKIRDEYMSRD